jgi:F-type H+-transporting ATPase subunit b
MAELIAELVGFVVMLFVLYRYVLPLVKKMVRERHETVQRQVDEAEEATRKLEQAQQRFESAVAEAKEEAARIRDDARADATRISEELKEQAEREVERIRARGEEQLAAQRDQVVRLMRAELGGQSMQLAEHLVVASLSDDASRSATIDSFLEDIDRLPARGSGSAERTDEAGGRLAAPAGGGAN